MTEEQVKLHHQEAISQNFCDLGTFTGQTLWFLLQINRMGGKKERRVELLQIKNYLRDIWTTEMGEPYLKPDWNKPTIKEI